MSSLSCHILDTTQGVPASDVMIHLQTLDGTRLESQVTNQDGRVSFESAIEQQDYCLRFEVKQYCLEHFKQAFFPFVDVNFSVSDERHYHIPLLLSPFTFSSYRGS